ncbi:hypothetical protein [Mucilaginibacter ginsenosidivorax]|uniref:Peptidase M41 domain-containing protein n=1 Tax=Mucilaginibacter ginsenosidivorax TaxID=862126 RepID=A0A5B8VW97_9SPHI|nr:hypothetical protein [Mucilaginibacter ginsenosidivorax]QEC75964.1 hypothetical protein FSB76_08395 [Mucilaginibacter ginsenosidivorax]
MKQMVKRLKKWRNRLRYYFTTPKGKVRRTCYHEAGHYMAAWLFPQLLGVNYVTIDRKNIDPQYRGGVHMSKLTPGHETWQEAEKIMLVNVAGMAATTIYSHGSSYVRKKISLFPNDETLVDAHGGTDDYTAAIGNARTTLFHLRIDPARLYWQGFQFMCLALMNPVIWEALTLLAENLYTNEEKKLTEAQISALFASKLDVSTLAHARMEILNQRYPLNRQNLYRLY